MFQSIQSRIASSLAVLAAASASAFSAESAPARVTFTKDVMPILQEKCQECHRPGQMAPMSLMTYDEARPWAKSMRENVAAGKMPPYFADKSSLKMKHDQSLTQAQKDTILAWIDAGTPKGDPKDMPAVREFKEGEGGWRLGTPDIVLQPLEPFPVPAGNGDLYQCFAVPFGVVNDLWLKGVEFKPDNLKAVHHFILFEDKLGKFKDFDAATPEPGCECSDMQKVLVGTTMVKMWAPGNVQPFTPQGIAQKLSANSNFILQVHYHNTTGEPQSDRSQFALYLAKSEEKIMKEVRGQLVVQPNLLIKAGDPESKFQATYTTKEDITLYSSGVHMHFRGKNMGMWAKRPGETDETTIVWVPNYDFNWQLSYEFAEAWKAPAGTTFTMRCTFDNSTNNPNNPDPTRDVRWGLASTEEMAFSGYSYTVDGEALNLTPEKPKGLVRSPALVKVAQPDYVQTD
jgi:hypothetical protein